MKTVYWCDALFSYDTTLGLSSITENKFSLLSDLYSMGMLSRFFFSLHVSLLSVALSCLYHKVTMRCQQNLLLPYWCWIWSLQLAVVPEVVFKKVPQIVLEIVFKASTFSRDSSRHSSKASFRDTPSSGANSRNYSNCSSKGRSQCSSWDSSTGNSRGSSIHSYRLS